MNRLEEIQECIKNFVEERKQVQQQISEIEEKRTQLAEKRNKIKKVHANNCMAEISELGKQISELGNQSQELQNKLDFNFNEVKKQINLKIDNLITEGIRKIYKIEEGREELEQKIVLQEERKAKYEIQKQEFYARFGRIPELSEEAIIENENQEQEVIKAKNEILEIENHVEEVGVELEQSVNTKRDFKNKNWANIVNYQTEENVEIEKDINFENMEAFFEDAITLPLVEEIEPIAELKIEPFEAIEELKIEPFEEIEEIKIEEFKPIKDISAEKIEVVQKSNKEEKIVDEIEEIAKAIVEEIATEQTKDLNISKIEEPSVEPKVTIEEKEEKIILSNIIVKIENGEIIYKAQVSNGDEIKVYPTKAMTGNKLLRDKENRIELKEILINYAIAKNKILDQKIIKKIDPIVCEVLIIFANKYNCEAQNLIYNYAMSFSKTKECEMETVPTITYNLSYINGTYLSKKEKATICKICKNARKNDRIDMIDHNVGIRGIKYFLKRIFAINNIKALPDGERK